MNLRSRLEATALVLALLLVAAFVVSAGTGVRLQRAGDGAAAAAGDSAMLDAPPAAVATGIRVEVLNGSGRAGLARDATERLRAAGYDVVYFGNAPESRGTSVVLDRGGRDSAARSSAATLGIRDVRSEPDAARMVDVTVLLGKDWPPAPPPRKTRWTDRLREIF